ncbi:uncharacterized protein LOC100123988 isoform X2 [Nasonia vitripennis]|uniref:RanBP2-type domain-containing protein n=1 Tax=Nasonia vitripennis TaxID=7425 RepID=A0A7M7QLC7_NASVI|nr:uncharacterized protein LOC100123988 isoform X2 [Nasonia vitripennis]
MNIIQDFEYQVQELRKKFEQCHLVYLQIEESPLKLAQRLKLEGIIEEYLSLVTNERKFVFQETSDIFYKSATTYKDFSGYKAAAGWCAISLYASNLLSQPWRREYRNIKTFSGFYKHEVESNLACAELMFAHMGYSMCKSKVLTLDGPIDPDKVSSVSRDAIVAFVECKILKRIWEEVSNNFNISWLEVLEFRKYYAGSADQAIRALNCRHVETLKMLAPQPNNIPKNSHRNDLDNDLRQDYKYSYPKGNSYEDFTPVFSHDVPGNFNADVNAKFRPAEPVYETQSFKARDNEFTPRSEMNNYRKSTDKINLLYRNDSREFPQELINEEPTFIQGSECIPAARDVPQNSLLFKEQQQQRVSKCNVKESDPILDTHEAETNEGSWNCDFCTFLNTDENVKICQMCGKTQKLNVDESFISDGKQCKQCTLLNSKVSSVCDACGFDL